MEQDQEGLLRAYSHPRLRDGRACPFCGGKNLAIFPGPKKLLPSRRKTMRVTCATCFSQGPTSISEEQAVARWNGESDRSRYSIRGR